MISVNQRAASIALQMIHDSEALNVSVSRLDNGATVIDAGIIAQGGLEAGRLFSCACLGGLGQVSFTQQVFPAEESGLNASFSLPAVAVSVDMPHVACMASQYAGWHVKLGRYFAIGSGPARALHAGEEIIKKLNYKDESEKAVLMLETREFPDSAVAAFIAERCGIAPDQLTLIVSPTASLVGSVQIAARSVETGLHKMAVLGLDVRCVTAGLGLCPLAPVAADDLRAIGRTNDAILYGSQVFYSVRASDDELFDLIERVPSAGSRDYGMLFYDLLLRYKGDFYQIDRLLFSPAEVTINNLSTGRTFHAGRLNHSLIRKSFWEDDACGTK
jgi:methenyltetrahydromethanopterin cyclohydrolase